MQVRSCSFSSNRQLCSEQNLFNTQALGDTEKTVDAAVLLLSHLVQGVKVATIWIRQDRIKKLINTVDGR